MKFLIVYAVLAVMAFEVSHANPNRRGTGRISGGFEILQNQRKIYKHQVLLLMNDGTKGCGGSIISKYSVITAAHCLNGMRSVRVYPGLYDKSQKYEAKYIEVTSENWIIHPDYIVTRDDVLNDLAIINLPESLEFGEFVGSIKIECNDEDRHDNEIVQVSGYGKHSDSDSDETTILRAAEVKTTSIQNCKSAYPYTKFTPSMICVDGKDNVGACKGDSGGPIVSNKNGKLIGVGSFADSKCVQSVPRVFTRVSSYTKWILANTVDYVQKNIC